MLITARVRYHQNGIQLCGKQLPGSHAGNRLYSGFLPRNSPLANIGNSHSNEERKKITTPLENKKLQILKRTRIKNHFLISKPNVNIGKGCHIVIIPTLWHIPQQIKCQPKAENHFREILSGLWH
mgnify:CR=1 FL=1